MVAVGVRRVDTKAQEAAMRTLILAGSYREAAEYARGVGLRHHRYASAAADVASFQAERVVELPGYAKRRDHHSIDALVKRLERRGVERVKDSYEKPPIEHTPETFVAARTSFEWLFGTAPADLVAIGATAAEVAEVQHLQDTAARVQDDVVLAFDGSKSDEMPAEIAGLTAADVHHITVTPTPSATKPAKAASARRKTAKPAPADDPFGD